MKVFYATLVNGTALLLPGAGTTTSYLAIVPGLILSGVGQAIVGTGIWIVADSGVHHSKKGTASTTLSVGDSVSLAVLITVDKGHAAGQVGVAYLGVVSEDIKLAFSLAADCIVVSLLAALTLLRKANVTGL